MKPRNPETERQPRIREFFPNWWHLHGIKMRVAETDEKQVVIKGSAAQLRISKWDDKYWRLQWQVSHLYQREWGSGQVLLTTEQLEAAFDLNNLTGEYGEWLIERFGGSSAEQGCYIRWGDFLNIPCPGTGHDGDPNISIELTDHIKQTVAYFITSARLADDRTTRPCCECGQAAAWVRHTQFAGDFYFCPFHAEQREDFGKQSNNNIVWEKLRG